MTRRLLLLATLLAAVTPAASAAAAPAAPPAAAAATAATGAVAERSIEILDFHSSIVVQRAGRIRVSERITLQFDGSWNGIYRTIPVEYRSPAGLNYRLAVRVHSVTLDGGTELEYETSRESDNLAIQIWIPGATDAARTVVLTYEVSHALRFFDEHDELYWNVTGNGWEYPIHSATAEVSLPAEVTGVRMSSFAGAFGSNTAAGGEQVGNGVYFRAPRPLGMREGLTVVVGWDRGVIARPTRLDRARHVLAGNGLLFVPIAAFLAMWTLWRRFGRDPDPGSIYVRYEPPPGLTPAEAGTLMDDTVDLRDITATLVDLAVRGFIEITETTESQLFGLVTTTDYEMTLLRPAEWPSLKAHERALLQALSVHSHDDRVRVSELQNEFYKHLPQIRKHLQRALTDGGMYVRHPHAVRGAWIAVAALSAVALGIMTSVLEQRYGISPAAGVIAAFLTLVIISVFGWLMPRRTMEGARTHAWLRGFEEFLARVDKDRLGRIGTPDAFEKYLPYAMAFGVEKNWARAFQGLASEPPDWYHGSRTGVFHVHDFVGGLNRMTAATATAMSSAPRSSGGAAGSGSSGFSSSGFSGGGFGGGGGRGF